MTMRRHDLNLLPVLDALLRHRNVTRAGQELGLSQSATSHALTRLREHFDDRLLAPAGNELRPTHRAEAMRAQVGDIMVLLERLLETDAFDPAQALRRFKIGTADYVAHLLLPALMGQILAIAPRVTLQLTWDHDQTAAKLRNGQLDLALMPRGSIAADDLHSETVYVDDLVVVAAVDHPALSDGLDLETFLRLPYAGFRRENASEPSFAERQLAQNNLHPHEALLVADFLPLAFAVAGTHCVSLVPRRIAENLRNAAGLQIFDAPFPAERLYIHAFWSHEAHGDVGHKWLRDIVQRSCSSLATPDALRT